MEDSKIVLGIVGSPNTQGRTHQLVTAALKGAADGGEAQRENNYSELKP